MKKVLLGTLAVLTLAACSKDEVIQQNPNDEISFSVTTNKAVSRAADGYCNKSLPTTFKVWANVSKTEAGGTTTYKPYFSGDEYTKTGETTYKNTTINRYWPSEAVSFFACKNATPAWKSDNSTLVVSDFTVNNDVTKQVDFIYATVKGATKPAADAPDKTQKINFRHALSQIEFAAINENTKIHVEISSVSVKNVYNNGNFEFPTVSTVDNIPGIGTHDPLPSDQTIANQGKWDVNTTTPKGSYTATLGSPVVVKSTNTSLTVTDPADQEWNSNTMYLMPYGKKAIAPTPSVYIPIWDGTGKPGASNDAYFKINAQIWNIASTTDLAAGTVNKGTDLVLYNGDIYVKLPDNSVWEQGKRYVYTFKFTTKGDGGTDSDGNPVLTPITLDVTIDDFVDGTGATINMEDK